MRAATPFHRRGATLSYVWNPSALTPRRIFDIADFLLSIGTNFSAIFHFPLAVCRPPLPDIPHSKLGVLPFPSLRFSLPSLNIRHFSLFHKKHKLKTCGYHTHPSALIPHPSSLFTPSALQSVYRDGSAPSHRFRQELRGLILR